MKELIEVIVKGVVDNKEEVFVTETEKADGTVELLINVNKDEIGKVIGKQGKVIKAIRTIAKSMSIKSDKKYFVEIAE